MPTPSQPRPGASGQIGIVRHHRRSTRRRTPPRSASTFLRGIEELRLGLGDKAVLDDEVIHAVDRVVEINKQLSIDTRQTCLDRRLRSAAGRSQPGCGDTTALNRFAAPNV